MHSILTNEKYCGDAILQKKFSIDVVLHTLKKNEGELPQYRIYNNHPAIIPKPTWEYVQELYSIKYTDNSYPLSNKIECGQPIIIVVLPLYNEKIANTFVSAILNSNGLGLAN